MRSLFFLFAVLGCSSGPNVADGGTDAGLDSDAAPQNGPDYASGTRLRAKTYTSADGAKQWYGWYDSQLKTNCAVGTADDGQKHCIPAAASVATDSFLDDQCTKPFARVEACIPNPTYATSQNGCQITTYALGAHAGTITSAWTTSNGGCQPVTGTFSIDAYELGAKADPATFVKQTLTRETRGPELSAQFLVGDDGSKQPNGMFDSVLKGTCSTWTGPNQKDDRCVPQHVGYAEGDYSDSNCTTAAVTVIPDESCFYPPDDLQTLAWVYNTPGTCESYFVTFAKIGAPATGPLFVGKPGTCSADTNAPAQWNMVGADVPTTSLPALSHTQTGQGRIIEDWQTAASSDRLYVDAFYDTQLKTICDPVIANDLKLRCVPHVADMDGLYADDQCTQALVIEQAATTCPVPTPPARVRMEYPLPGCGVRYGVYDVGAKITAPATTWHWNGVCEPISYPTADFYATTEVAPSTFAEITDTTE